MSHSLWKWTLNCPTQDKTFFIQSLLCEQDICNMIEEYLELSCSSSSGNDEYNLSSCGNVSTGVNIIQPYMLEPYLSDASLEEEIKMGSLYTIWSDKLSKTMFVKFIFIVSTKIIELERNENVNRYSLYTGKFSLVRRVYWQSAISKRQSWQIKSYLILSYVI